MYSTCMYVCTYTCTCVGMKTERKPTELSATIFVFTFFAEAETHRETSEMNTEIDTTGNGHRANTKRIRKQK